MTIDPARISVAEMIEALRALPSSPQVEQRDIEEIPEPEGL
jgi:hypothetical protein